MPAPTTRSSRLVLGLAVCAVVAGCGSFNSATQRVASSFTPYKPPVVQGNFVSREQAEALRPGMSRQQVRELLGTPLITSLFHGNRWDYVFTLNRQGMPAQSHRLTIFFKDERLERFEGDTLPTEAEFVDQIDTRRVGARIPALDATEAQLERFAKPAARPSEPPPPPAAANYPPLEPSVR